MSEETRGAGPVTDASPASATATASAVDRPRRGWTWALAAVATVLVIAVLALVYDPRWYFYGDTQIGAFGAWFDLGKVVRSGHLPLLDLTSWRAGNFAAEGQWGLWSPLTIGIGVLASLAPNAVVFSTVVKLVLLVTGALGTFTLVRSYETPAPLAYVAAVTVPFGGTALFLESPSWVTGQMCWALLPWAWWGLRRTMAGRSPWIALVAGYLIVTIGYVYGTIYLILVISGCLLDCALARNRTGALRVVLVGVVAGLLAVTVYLPGILTAAVTTRAGTQLRWTGTLDADWQGLVAGILPTGLSTASAGFPYEYLAWFLPLLAWLRFTSLRAELRRLAGLLLVLALLLLWVLGPEQIGPIRWPVRVVSVFTLVLVIAVTTLLGRARAVPASSRRLAATIGLVVVATVVTIIGVPAAWGWQLGSLVFVSVGLVVVAKLRGRTRDDQPADDRGLASGRRLVLVCAFIGVWTLAATTLAQVAHPHPPSTQRNMPSRIADYKVPLAAAKGDAMLLGNPQIELIAYPDASRDFLIGNSWYLGGHHMQSTYSTIGFRAYNRRYCFVYHGGTCYTALATLFDEEGATGLKRVDLLSVSTLLFVRADFSIPLDPPAGWRVAKQTDYAEMWVRDKPVPAAGGVVWSSSGTSVSRVTSSTRVVSFKVGSVPAGGGTVTFSRLAWPGYSVTNGSLADSVDGYLLTVDVPPGSEGKTVTVRFLPPGWWLEVATWSIAVLLGGGWIVLAAVRSRRRRRDTMQPERSAEQVPG
ncbi:MAG TPA: hypothetical protein VIM10_17690 [Actinopolymorphaceae bacterium]|jgi:hypothetical protein